MSRGSQPREPGLYRELTVARVRSAGDAEDVEVMFLESARIFRLPRADRRFHELLGQLREGERFHVGLESVDSDVILDVRAM